MSSFSCACGHVTYGLSEPPNTSWVAYPLPALHAVQRRIAEHVSTFAALPSPEERAAWERSFYGAEIGESSLDIIEDIVALELNDGFTAMYRCPACGRVALKGEDTEHWTFFRPET